MRAIYPREQRRRSLVTISVTLATLSGSTVSAAEQGRPNVIFIFADDLGFGDINVHRDDAFRAAADQPNGRERRSDEWRGRVFTPGLDRIAREGADFHQFVVASPVCAPSRVACMTGQFPSRNRIHHIFTTHRTNVARGMPDWLRLGAPFLVRELRAAGYKAGHFGKWHLGHGENAPKPKRWGFAEAKLFGPHESHVFDVPRYAHLREQELGEEAASWRSIAATDHCLDFIRDHADEPFYVNLWLHETHHVVSARPEDRKGYEDVPEPYQTYYAAVTRMDAQVGRVLDLLDELDLAEDTLVIFSSDNGPENHTARLDRSVGSPAGMRGRKRSLFLGGTNVPFLCRWPGVIPAGLVDRTTTLGAVDLMPTILAAADAPNSRADEMDGENILPALRGEPFRRTKSLFWFWIGHAAGDNWPRFGVRRNEYAMLVDPAADRVELFDVLADRYQRNDLADSRPDVLASMSGELDAWIASLPQPIPYDLETGESPDAPSRSRRRDRSAPNATPPKKKGTGTTDASLPPVPGSRAMPKADDIDRTAVFQRKDRDRDGFLSLAEFSKNLRGNVPAERRFARFDTDGDRKISPAEFSK